jgi:hypothetical protein
VLALSASTLLLCVIRRPSGREQRAGRSQVERRVITPYLCRSLKLDLQERGPARNGIAHLGKRPRRGGAATPPPFLGRVLINAQIAGGHALALRLRYGYAQFGMPNLMVPQLLESRLDWRGARDELCGLRANATADLRFPCCLDLLGDDRPGAYPTLSCAIQASVAHDLSRGVAWCGVTVT